MSAPQQMLLIGRTAGDPYFSFVTALLHFNGADASTTFTDVITKTWTVNGNAQIDTAQSKFGGASGLFDGSGDFLTTPSIAGINLASNTDYTIECWVRMNSLSASSSIVYKRSEGADDGGYELQVSSTGAMAYTTANGGSTTTTITGTGLIVTGQWYHVAVSNNGPTGARRLYIDGVQQASATVAHSTSIFQLKIGSAFSGARNFNGWIDDLRITNGVSRYNSNFTPPNAEFPDS
jgi:hypothetical protein